MPPQVQAGGIRRVARRALDARPALSVGADAQENISESTPKGNLSPKQMPQDALDLHHMAGQSGVKAHGKALRLPKGAPQRP